jgi:hypothetical protein
VRYRRFESLSYNQSMERRPRPLLSRYEEALADANGVSKMHPRDETTSADKVYSSTLLDTDVASAQVSDISRNTRVGAETTDDE